MRNLKSLLIAFAVGLWSAIAPLGTAFAVAGPEAYSGINGMTDITISPDGLHLSAVERYNGRQAIFVYGLGPNAGQSQILQIPSDFPDDLRVIGASWANNKRLLVYLKFADRRPYGVTTEYRRLGVNIDGSNVQVLPKVIRQEKRPQGAGSIYDMLPDDPDHVLLTYYKPKSTNGYTPFKMDINTGQLEPVAYGDWDAGNYMSDLKGQTRLRYVADHLKRKVQTRKDDDSQWETVWEFTLFEDPYFDVLSFTPDPNKIFVASDHETNGSAVYEFDLTTRKFGKRIWSHPIYDASRIMFNAARDKVIAVGYMADGDEFEIFDAEFAAKYQVLKQAFPGSVIRISGISDDDSKWVVLVSGPHHPTASYLYDTVNVKLSKIGSAYPDVPAATTSSMMPISYKARDGLEIPGYITLPNTGSAPYPLVVHPHGGPSSRDVMYFNSEVQFLAAQGYAVFQPNFRGSTGYGSEFQAAGYKQWGLAMQDDITDGVEFLISQGMVDRDRICIVGWSYGGYAALMGVVKTPDLYKCAVAGAGISDIPLLLQQEYHADVNGPTVGGWSERGQLRETSPARNIDDIKAPILLVHGTHDQTVAIEQSRLMAGKLRDAGKPYRLLVLENDDHNRSIPENEVLYLQELQGFLAQYLK
ncbi:MAG: S9 family peptidase [Alphaproteobacteria bacterium]|nr:MAG: S9 family peptidase [Alphaproteobacteria bacterium]